MSLLKNYWPLAAFFALCMAFGFALTRDPKVLPSQMIDKPFPGFKLPDLYDGDTVLSNETFKGRPVLVNVFGSWCAACVQEHSTLMALKNRGEIEIVGIDWRDTRPAGIAWLARYGNPYTSVIFDAHSELAIPLGVAGAPESFVVDAAGNIRYKHVGIITPQVWKTTLSPIFKTLETGS